MFLQNEYSKGIGLLTLKKVKEKAAILFFLYYKVYQKQPEDIPLEIFGTFSFSFSMPFIINFYLCVGK